MTASATSFDLNGKTINVKGHATDDAYEFDADGNLSAVNADKGDSVDIEGQNEVIKEGTEIQFASENGALVIEKIFVQDEVTVNVYKKKGAKETVVKVGKKIVFSEGKVVKAG